MAIAGTQASYPGAGATGTLVKIFDITALAADTAGAITHGMLATPMFALFEPRDAAFYILVEAAPNTAPMWTVASITSTVVNLAKNGVAGSGGAVPGTTVLFRLHTGSWPLTNVNV